MSVPAEHDDPAQAPSIPETALTPSKPFIPDSGVGWTASDWLGKAVVDREGQRIGKLHGIYVDVETDEPQFGTVKEGVFGRHLTFVPLAGRSGRSTSLLLLPTISSSNTAWCATIDRPASVTMSGWVQAHSAQTSVIVPTTALAYSRML